MKIFISYRRADDPTLVQLLFTHLSYRYGRDNVFMDFASIPLFSRFEDFIKSKIAESDVVIVIIGVGWLEEFKKREQSGDKDYVRIEIQEALRLNKPIAPIAIQGASLPDPKIVPADLSLIFDRNAETLRDGQELELKLSRIVADLEKLASLQADPALAPKAGMTPAPPAPVTVLAGESLESVFQRFAAAQSAGKLEEALLLLEMLRDRNLPEFFELDGRIAALRKTLQQAAEARQRRQAAEYLYGVVRGMVALDDPPEKIHAGLREVWKVEAGYDPDEIEKQIPPVPVSRTEPAPIIRDAVQVRALQPLNPIDWIRLYIWLFFQPGQLVSFRKSASYREGTPLKLTGVWLSATLSCLPLAIPLAGVLAGRVAWTGDENGLFSLGGLAAVVVIIWLIVGLLGFVESLAWSLVALIVAFVVAAGVTVGVAAGVTGGVAFGVAVGVAGAAAIVVAGVNGGVAAVVVLTGVGGGVIGSMAGGGAGGAVGGMVVLVAIGLTNVVERQLKADDPTPTWRQIVLGLAAPIAYAVLIAKFWFGVPLP